MILLAVKRSNYGSRIIATILQINGAVNQRATMASGLLSLLTAVMSVIHSSWCIFRFGSLRNGWKDVNFVKVICLHSINVRT